ncbi:MAG: RidA family protein [Promethearchaeota archaeon]|jgi:2-iminobutanoate/2-iminopropanoate deaminase
MKKEIIKINTIKSPDGPFNHVVKGGNLLFLTSQLSADLNTNKILKGDITEQTRIAMENIKFLLESSGSTMNDILKVVVYMRKVKEFDKMNRVYSEYFEKGQEPARVTIQAKSPIKNIDIEIEAIALLP